MNQREALQLALEALEVNLGTWSAKKKAIPAIKEVLAQPEPSELDVWKSRALQAEAVIEKFMAQPEQEPVAWRYRMPVEDGHWVWNYATYIDDPKDHRCEPLYITPPQSEPVIDKSAAIRIATSLGWEPKRKPLTIVELQKHWQVAKVFDMTDAEISFPDYVLITKDVEALHGIKEKNS